MNWIELRPTESLTNTVQATRSDDIPRPRPLDPIERFFGLFLIAHIIIWTLLAALTQSNLPAETLGLLTAGQSPAWGYFDQPPLPVWLMSLVSAIFAPAAWPAYLLAQICIATCMWSAWKIGKDFLHPWTAVCGAIVLEGCFFFTIGSAAFTSAHLAGACWALAILALYHGFQLERRLDWVIVGVCLGLGMLSHYSTALLFVAMLSFSLLNHQARRCWDTSWPFLAAVIAGVIILPHFWWAWSHDFSTISTAMHSWKSISSRGEFTIYFVISQLLAVVPMLILLIPLISYFRMDEPNSTEDEEREFVRQYLLVVTLLPAALMLALTLIGGVDLGSTGLTLWTFMGVLMLLWSDLDESRMAWRKVILHSGAAGGGFAALLVVMNYMVPHITSSATPADIHFPGRELAREVRGIWKAQGYTQPLSIVAGPNQLAQNASWYHGTFHRPLAYNNLDDQQSVGVNDEKLRAQGGVILWTTAEHQQYVEETQRFNSENSHVEIMAEPILIPSGKSATAEPMPVYVAIVHPTANVSSPTPESEVVPILSENDFVLPLQTADSDRITIR